MESESSDFYTDVTARDGFEDAPHVSTLIVNS